ncbi:MAG: YkgJ family cysteine cluster protein [archaeon]|nr:YkgJ family cysteine cluster protein [archaeon]
MVKADKFLLVCRKCKAACCKMGGATFTGKEMKKVLKKGYKNYFFKVKEGIYELKSKKGRCPYLKKDNSCEIHKIKPILCLCYPVFQNFDKQKNGYIIIECPMAKILSKKEIEKCKKEVSKIPIKFLEMAINLKTIKNKKDRKLIKKRFKKFKIKELK